jgi:WD40 repeat protein
MEPEPRDPRVPAIKMDSLVIRPDGRVACMTSPNAVSWHATGEWSVVGFSRPAQSATNWDAVLRSISEIPVLLPFNHTQNLYERGSFSPDGKVVLTSNRLWETATGRPIGEAWDLPAGRGTSTFSPDGQVVLTSRFDDLTGRGSIQFWDAATGRSLGGPLEQHEAVFQAAFSPDHLLLLIPHDDDRRSTED